MCEYADWWMCGLVDVRIGGCADWWMCGFFDVWICGFFDLWIYYLGFGKCGSQIIDTIHELYLRFAKRESIIW